MDLTPVFGSNALQWHERAACAQDGDTAEIFVAVTVGDMTLMNDAMRVSAGCPVFAECDAYATEHHEHHSVWAGQNRALGHNR